MKVETVQETEAKERTVATRKTTEPDRKADRKTKKTPRGKEQQKKWGHPNGYSKRHVGITDANMHTTPG